MRKRIKTGPGTTGPDVRAKVFWSGRSQAVRLPKQFRFAVHEVVVTRRGPALVLAPPLVAVDERGWPLGFWDVFGSCPDLDLGVRDAPHERSHPLGKRA